MKINKELVSSLHRLVKKGNDRKSLSKASRIKLENYKINLYDSRGRIIGSLKQGESIDYQKLLLKKRR